MKISGYTCSIIENNLEKYTEYRTSVKIYGNISTVTFNAAIRIL